MTEPSTIALPEALLGKGFYKLGYVTTDRERAIEHWKTRLGIEQFVPFEPAFEARLRDGRIGHASLRCAFSAGRDIVVEVMQPVEGLVDLWARPLAGAGGFAMAFHHFGLVTDDLAAVKTSAARYGLEPVLEATIPVATFSYLEPPGLGHYVEHIQYFGEGAKFLESVRTRPIPKE